jgi:hypothetical protein
VTNHRPPYLVTFRTFNVATVATITQWARSTKKGVRVATNAAGKWVMVTHSPAAARLALMCMKLQASGTPWPWRWMRHPKPKGKEQWH